MLRDMVLSSAGTGARCAPARTGRRRRRGRRRPGRRRRARRRGPASKQRAAWPGRSISSRSKSASAITFAASAATTPSAAWTTKRGVRPAQASAAPRAPICRDSEYSIPYWLITAPKPPSGKGRASTPVPGTKLIAAISLAWRVTKAGGSIAARSTATISKRPLSAASNAAAPLPVQRSRRRVPSGRHAKNSRQPSAMLAS